MSEATSGSDQVDDLVEGFLERYRRGERPSLTEYTDKYPELAERIRTLFPALLVMEEIGSGDGQATGSFAGQAGAGASMPQRLGDYVLLQAVGSGGMGIVYEAIQESLGRHVALKVLPFHHLGDTTRLERFRREARAAARLHHTHIVPVHGIGEHDGLHFYTMQFIRGHGLDAVLHEVRRLRHDSSPPDPAEELQGPVNSTTLAINLRAGRFPANKAEPGELGAATGGTPQTHQVHAPTSVAKPPLPAESHDRSSLSDQPEGRYVHSVARIGADVAEALEYAHLQGILHRDIKPSNLLLDAQGHVWITDFGLAKAQDSDELTRTGDIVGTLKCMAPERFKGWSDPRSDVYALGATLYELLTLRPAFEESDRVELIEQVLHQSPPPLRQLDRRIPRDLETIVLKSLAKEPGERYSTAQELAEDLRRFDAGRPILARRSSAIERSWRWSRRNPLLAGATVTVATALLAVVVISLRYAREQSRANQDNRTLAQKLTRSLAESNRLLAIRNFDRGQVAFEKDLIGQGLLWMIESWRSAVEADDRDWQHAARANLAAWRPHHARLKAVFSHENPVAAAAFSPDDQTVLSGCSDGTARLWDTATGKPIGRPMDHPGSVFAVAYSPNGKTVLIGCSDGTARLWDVATGQSAGSPLRHEGAVRAVAYSPDGRTILTGSTDKKARLWNAATLTPVCQPSVHEAAVTAVAFSPDGTTILTGCEDVSARFWDAGTGKPIGSALQPGPAAVAVGNNLDGKPAEIPFENVVLNKVFAVAYSPDGKTVLTGCKDGTVQSWDAVNGNRLGQPMRHRFKIRSVAISPDGKRILVGSEDKMARFWDAVTNQPSGLPLVHQGPVGAVAFSHDGKTLLTASSDNTVRLWDADPGRPFGLIAEHADVGHAVAYGPDGKSILTGHYAGTARHSVATSGEIIGQTIHHQGPVVTVSMSPDGSNLLTGSFDKTARRWDSTTGKPVGPPLLHEDEVNLVAFSPDGKTILTGTEDRMARLWDASTGTPLSKPIPQSDAVDAGAFSPDGKSFVVGCGNGSVQVWDLATRTPLGQPLLHPGCISAAAFSPDGKTLLTGCEDGAARLWDLETRTLRTVPLLHQAWIWAVAFSPDGKTVLTGSRDRTARLWDAATGMPLGPAFIHPHEVWSVAFSPDGHDFLTGAYDYRARLYRKVPELADDLERVAAWVEVITGLTLDPAQGAIRVLDNAAWLARREQLEQLGGPPQ
jgi:WD40 repeat protein/serine/threonine protein kinase